MQSQYERVQSRRCARLGAKCAAQSDPNDERTEGVLHPEFLRRDALPLSTAKEFLTRR
jgi:hypothetical protein